MQSQIEFGNVYRHPQIVYRAASTCIHHVKPYASTCIPHLKVHDCRGTHGCDGQHVDRHFADAVVLIVFRDLGVRGIGIDDDGGWDGSCRRLGRGRRTDDGSDKSRRFGRRYNHDARAGGSCRLGSGYDSGRRDGARDYGRRRFCRASFDARNSDGGAGKGRRRRVRNDRGPFRNIRLLGEDACCGQCKNERYGKFHFDDSVADWCSIE